MPLTGPQATLAAAGIQTAGSILGGMFGSKDSNVGPHEYRDAAYGTIKGKLAAARKFGVHPLYALGSASPGPMQAIPGQSNLGSIAKDASAIAAGAIRDLHHQRTQKAQTDLIEAQTENWKLRNEALRKANTGPNAPVTQGAVSFPIQHEPQRRSPQADMRWDQKHGWLKQTPEGVRMDITEAIGGDVDAWVNNPRARESIENKWAEAWKSLPGIRNYYEAKRAAKAYFRDVANDWHRTLNRSYR